MPEGLLLNQWEDNSMSTAIIPVTAGILGLIYFFLGMRVSKMRMDKQIGIGTGSNKTLNRVVRVHSNFIEYVPICLILLLIVQGLGANIWFILIMAILLIVARLMHAAGLSKTAGASLARRGGAALTYLVLLLLSLGSIFYAVSKL